MPSKFKVPKSTLLQKLDVDDDGDVDLQDLFALFKDQDGDGDFDLQDMYILADSDGDGQISIAEGATALAGFSLPALLIYWTVLLVLSVLGVFFVKKQIDLAKLQKELKAEKVPLDQQYDAALVEYAVLVELKALQNAEKVTNELKAAQAKLKAATESLATIDAKIAERMKGAARENAAAPGAVTNIAGADIHFEKPLSDLKPLGVGGFGKVYKSSERGWNGATVAVKVCNSAVATKEFDAEAELLASLLHDNVVCFRGMCTLLGRPALVTEFISGGTIDDALYKPVQPSKVSLQGSSHSKNTLVVAEDVVAAMSYLHNHVPPIVHRDLKPENVLLEFHNQSVRGKVADYGMSTLNPLAGVCGGTLPYIAPELLRFKDYGSTVDVYSFGIMLNEMLSGGDGTRDYVPWFNKHDGCNNTTFGHEMMKDHVKLGKRPRINSTVHEKHKTIITQCWTATPSDRPTFKRVMEMLRSRAIAADGDVDAEAAKSIRNLSVQ